jgi:hypothetical protein
VAAAGFLAEMQDSKINSPMSALGQKQTLKRLRRMSALPPKADIGIGDIRRDPPRLVLGEQFGR